MPTAVDLQSDILIENLGVLRGGKEIIHGIDARIRTGRTTVIMGASGCGKSTLLKVAAGITMPDRGRVLVGDKDIHSLSEKDTVRLRMHWGFVFQDAALWANKTILQNLTLPLLYHDSSMRIEDAEHKAERLLRATGYRDELTLRPSQLSTGEMKMVSFARALISDPKVLFLDSPFLAVDYTSVEKMRNIIAEFKQGGGTVCAVFQDPKYISRVAEDLIVMKDGRIIAAGAFTDIIHTRDGEVSEVISELLDQAASYDGSILDILSDTGAATFDGDSEKRK